MKIVTKQKRIGLNRKPNDPFLPFFTFCNGTKKSLVNYTIKIFLFCLILVQMNGKNWLKCLQHFFSVWKGPILSELFRKFLLFCFNIRNHLDDEYHKILFRIFSAVKMSITFRARFSSVFIVAVTYILMAMNLFLILLPRNMCRLFCRAGSRWPIYEAPFYLWWLHSPWIWSLWKKNSNFWYHFDYIINIQFGCSKRLKTRISKFS